MNQDDGFQKHTKSKLIHLNKVSPTHNLGHLPDLSSSRCLTAEKISHFPSP